MKSNKSIVMVSFLLVSFFTSAQKVNQRYIRMHYSADPSKPYPIVIFYLPGSIDTAYENFFTRKIKVTEAEFEDIRKSIEEKRFASKDTILKSELQFTIESDGETWIFLTKYISKIRQIFQNIANQFKDDDKRKLVSRQLDYLFGRIRYDLLN